MNHQLYIDYYLQAQKLGRKEQRQRVQIGQYPYLQALDELLAEGMSAGEVDLGLLEIPAEKIVGTRTSGRTNAFAANFMPLLAEESEFAQKWCKLCEAHLSDEGIRDAVSCYEYMGRFYIQEGNKRVSVLKFFGATAIPAHVIRILPADKTTPEGRAYAEFLSYYPQTQLYEVYFSRSGSFPKLQAALGYESEHVWTRDERRRFLSGFFYFQRAFRKLGGISLQATASDALLEWLKLYSFDSLLTLSDAHLTKSLEAIWADVKSIGHDHVIELSTNTGAEERGFISRRTLSMMPSYFNAAFIHELHCKDSNWIKAHELGSRKLEEVMGERVTVQRYFGVGSGEAAERAMEEAIEKGAEVIFATTAPLIGACRRVAARHPETKILNCSVSMPYADVRTYYSRIYEGKFISGAIAGAMSRSGRVGYIASYPIFGVPAGINAFALGLQLTAPEARVELKWACVNRDSVSELRERQVDVISTLDIPLPGWTQGRWGTFRLLPDGSSQVLASPYWDWGAFYIHIARSILNGDWDVPFYSKREHRAVNYWWGMASGVIGVEWTDALPLGTRILAETLKRGIIDGSLDPFLRPVRSQDGTLRTDGSAALTGEELLHMDWLCENVDGGIPAFEELNEKGKGIVRLQGIYRDSIPPQKEGVLL